MENVAIKTQINRGERRLIAHRFMLVLNIIGVCFIMSVSYALFEPKFNKWISTTGTFFIPLIMTIQLVGGLIYNYITKSILIDNIIKQLNQCYSCRRILKDDYYEILSMLEKAEIRQSAYENGVLLTHKDIKEMKDKKLLSDYKEIVKKVKE